MYHPQQDPGAVIVRKRLSFLSVLILSLTAILVTAIISVTGISLYGLRILNVKADGVIDLIGQVARGLPELREALPPALADAIDDERRPDYLDSLGVSVRLVVDDDDSRYQRAVVEIQNRGDAIVSLLSMRLVGLDEDGDPVVERNTWAATPIQIDNDWRGPLMPHETRRFAERCYRWHGSDNEVEAITYEITDIRVWRDSGGEIDSTVLESSTALALPRAR